MLCSYGFLLLSVVLARVFFCIAEMQLEGIFQDGVFYGVYDYSNISFVLLMKTGFVSSAISNLLFIIIIEGIYEVKKRLFSIITVVLIVLTTVAPFKISRFIVNIIGISILFVTFILILLYQTKYSKTEIMAISAFILLGLTILLSSTFYYGIDIKKSNKIFLFTLYY